MTGPGTVEREVKLGAWPGFQLPDLDEVVPGARVELLPSLRLAATYYDTPDLRLARWGATVRHRLSAPPTDEPAWTLKLPASPLPGALARREIGFPGSETRVPPGLLSLVRGLSRGAPLVPVARLRTDRRRWELRDTAGPRLAEIDDDEVSVLVAGAGGRGRRLAARFRELEVELAEGGLDVMDAVVTRLRAAGAGEPDPTPKVVRALGPRALEPPDVLVPHVGRRSSAGDVVRACLASSAVRLFRHDPGVRLGGDPEDVHQARVATRRLRSDLRTFGPLLDAGWARELRDELGWLAGLLGAVRDADVLLERLQAQSELLPKSDAAAAEELLRGLERQQADATVALHEAMGSGRYTALLDALVAAAAAPRFAAPSRPAAEHLPGVAAPGEASEAAAARAARADEEREAVLMLSGPASASFTLATPAPGLMVAPSVAVDAGAVDEGAPVDEAAPIDEATAIDEASVHSGAGVAAAPPLALAPQGGTEPSAAELPLLVRRPWRRLWRSMAGLGPAPEDEALHAVRIEAKRCRYAMEAVAPAVGKDASNLAAAVADLQGVLGDLHDAVVAEAWLRQAVADAPPAQALAAGQLIAIQRADADTSRKAWAAAWARASRKRSRAWLRRGGSDAARGGRE
ncbi:MAG TPA: CHAD domain-containing protein [Acidimicrobiales bacterium]|nr:CHAD domain-containing protein [Acidimicrobiales bacterium]